MTRDSRSFPSLRSSFARLPFDRPVAAIALVAAIAVVGAAAHAGAVGPFAESDRTLVVADADTGDRLLETPVEDGTDVTLAYTHSVEKTPVRDVYVVDDDRLRMVRMEFDSYGAGLPSGADVERTEDGLVAPMDRPYERVRVVPGSIAGHELRVGDDRYDLVNLSDGGVVIFVVDGSADALEFPPAHETVPMAIADETGTESDVETSALREGQP